MERNRVEHTKVIQFDSTRRGPLEGVRVLDLSRLVAGNMLSLQLADLGAEVTKVEPPQGDPLRDWLDDVQPPFVFDGKMVDEPVVARARALLSRAEHEPSA